MSLALEHLHGHLDVERVTSPVGHILQKLVIFNHNEWILLCIILTLAEVRVFNVDSATSGSDILTEHVICENYWSCIALDVKRCHSFDNVDNLSVVKCLVRIDHLLEEVSPDPLVVHANLELDVLARALGAKICEHLWVFYVVESLRGTPLTNQYLLYVGYVLYETRIEHLYAPLEALSVQNQTLVLES